MKINMHKLVRSLVEHAKETEIVTPAQEKSRIWNEIQKRVARRKRKSSFRTLYISLASSAAILIALIYWVNYSYNHQSESILVAASKLESDFGNQKEITLVLSEDKNIEIVSESEILYKEDGGILVNDKEIGEEKTILEAQFNQLIVPKGRRTQVLLSDGTKMWINSGTRVVYPRKFDSKTREIFVDGEIFLDVVPDKSTPFIVKTSTFDVEVSGTSFNVSAYSREGTSSVLLVEGKVNVQTSKKNELELKPNQIVDVSEGIIGQPGYTDVEKYICWRDNMLIFDDDHLRYAFKKLDLYYDRRFVLEEGVDTVRLDGKLDLKEDLTEILKSIAFTTSIQFSDEGDVIRITRDK